MNVLLLKDVVRAWNIRQKPIKDVELLRRFTLKRDSYNSVKDRIVFAIHSNYCLSAHSNAQRLL